MGISMDKYVMLAIA